MVKKFLKRFMEKRWKRQNKQCLDWKINKKKKIKNAGLVWKIYYENLKGAAGINISKLSTKSDLASLKAQVDKLDIDWLKDVNTGWLVSKIAIQCRQAGPWKKLRWRQKDT